MAHDFHVKTYPPTIDVPTLSAYFVDFQTSEGVTFTPTNTTIQITDKAVFIIHIT